MSLYKTLVDNLKWSLNDIDDTNLETLVDYLFYRPDMDPNVRVIKGKQYRRASQAPSWL